MKKSLEERFMENVDTSVGIDACWPWLGTVTGPGKKEGKGYGRISVNGRVIPVSQVAWSLWHGKPFPEGMHGCHTCDNPPCANPTHIFPGTQLENLNDMATKGRKPVGEKKARRGAANGRTVLHAEAVVALRTDSAAGMDGPSLARKYGISKTQTYRIIRGENQSG
jgi:hypothetical protein